jgi:UPF0716 protein FxsA
MVGVLGVLFLLVPLAELAVIVQVSGAVGLGNTIVLLVVVSVVGAWLCKREGIGVMRRVQTQLERGVVPGREVLDGFLILLAGALMLTPGFLTDVLAILLLVPPSRAVVRAVLTRRFGRGVQLYTATDRIHDVRSTEDPSGGDWSDPRHLGP